MKQNRMYISQYEIEKKDSSSRIIDINISPIIGSTGIVNGYRGIINDLTDRLKAEKELLKATKIESLGIFAGGIAHDFNNLLM